jgi:hypothetical protein
MAFKSSNMRTLSSIGGGGARIWLYRTEDSDTSSADYFLPFAGNLQVGDIIHVTVLTNLGKTSEAYSSAATYRVTAATSATVTVESAEGVAVQTYRTTDTLDQMRAPIANAAEDTYLYPDSNAVTTGHLTMGLGEWGGVAAPEQDQLVFFRIPSVTYPSIAVHYAEFTINLTVFTAGAAPTFRVRLIKSLADVTWPTQSADRIVLVGYTAEATPASYPGPYTTAYTDWTPQGTGIEKIDITAQLNEIIATSPTATTIYVVLEPIEPTDTVGGGVRNTPPTNATLVNRPSVYIYPDLSTRAAQTKVLPNTSIPWFWPVDAQDLAGDAAATGIRVVSQADVAASVVSLEVPFETPALPMAATKVPSDYLLHITTSGLTELTHSHSRRLVSPRQETAASLVDSPNETTLFDEDNYWYQPVKTSNQSYLWWVQQKQQTSNEGMGYIWDNYGSSGFGMTTFCQPDAAGIEMGIQFEPGSGVAPYYDSGLTYENVVGTVKTIVAYYDSSTDKLWYGYCGSGSWSWVNVATVVGVTGIQNCSGIQTPAGKIQSIGMLQFKTTIPKFRHVQMAMERARTLWLAGVKSLPPTFFT